MGAHTAACAPKKLAQIFFMFVLDLSRDDYGPSRASYDLLVFWGTKIEVRIQ